MALYLRFTATPYADLHRGTSLHDSAFDVTEYSKEEATKAFLCNVTDIIEINGFWKRNLNGLCGYELRANNVSDALKEICSTNYPLKYFSPLCGIYFGVEASDTVHVPDGDCFVPLQLLKTFWHDR